MVVPAPDPAPIVSSEPRSLRVVHVITGLATGGAERMLQERLTRTRHTVEVVALSVEGEIADRLRADGVPVHYLGMRGNRDVFAVFALARLLRRLRPDLVHAHLYRALIYGRLASRLAGVPAVIATEHSALVDSTEGRRATAGVRRLYRVSERFGRLTIAVSSTTRDILARYWGVAPDRIVVVPNGIDIGRLRITSGARARSRKRFGLAAHDRVVVAAGRLVEGKRFDLVLDAVARLDPDVRLLVAGDGPVRQSLQDRAERLGIADRVHLVGTVEDILDVLAAGDLFASASQVETYGIAIIEAYAAGLPVAYTQCPALQDLIGVTESTRVIESEPDADRLAWAIRTGLTQAVGPEHVPAEHRTWMDIDKVSGRLDDIEQQVVVDGPAAARALNRL